MCRNYSREETIWRNMVRMKDLFPIFTKLFVPNKGHVNFKTQKKMLSMSWWKIETLCWSASMNEYALNYLPASSYCCSAHCALWQKKFLFDVADRWVASKKTVVYAQCAMTLFYCWQKLAKCHDLNCNLMTL